MYNGVGLQTPRGSGTNGYIQRSMAFLKPKRTDFDGVDSMNKVKAVSLKVRKADEVLLDHDRKRKIEIELLKLEDSLVQEKVDAAEIKKRVSELRTELYEKLKNKGNGEAIDGENSESLKKLDTHQIAALKEKEMAKISSAFKIARDTHKVGETFNFELQEQKKILALQEKQKKNEILEQELDMLDKKKRRLNASQKKSSKRNFHRRSASTSSASSSSSTDSSSEVASISSSGSSGTSASHVSSADNSSGSTSRSNSASSSANSSPIRGRGSVSQSNVRKSITATKTVEKGRSVVTVESSDKMHALGDSRSKGKRLIDGGFHTRGTFSGKVAGDTGDRRRSSRERYDRDLDRGNRALQSSNDSIKPKDGHGMHGTSREGNNKRRVEADAASRFEKKRSNREEYEEFSSHDKVETHQAVLSNLKERVPSDRRMQSKDGHADFKERREEEPHRAVSRANMLGRHSKGHDHSRHDKDNVAGSKTPGEHYISDTDEASGRKHPESRSTLRNDARKRRRDYHDSDDTTPILQKQLSPTSHVRKNHRIGESGRTEMSGNRSLNHSKDDDERYHGDRLYKGDTSRRNYRKRSISVERHVSEKRSRTRNASPHKKTEIEHATKEKDSKEVLRREASDAVEGTLRRRG